ncbi:sensory transduction histidine kinase [Methanosarcina siciliae HI350]|uniref:Sensory transduction histidine kinase n=2 Tax=Methanosarcina siciliae TaxID=38027 RepID=A0A0E3PC69_9EURY|nr:sensory transduction histidine kinase [Methanosarcina siciliae HI350]
MEPYGKMKARMEHFPAKNPNPVLSVEKDGTVLYSNEAAKPLLIEWGVETGEKLPSHIGDIVEGVLCRNRPEKMEIKVGKKVYLVTFQLLPEEECVNIYGFDISDQKVLEEKLRESEKKYRIVADNTFDWEFWLGPDGRFLYISPSCEQVTGYTVREFMDNPDLLQEIIHSDDRQEFLQHRHEFPSHHSVLEFRIITKDGEIRWLRHLCQPVYDGKGCYAGSRGSNRDITERKQEEQRVRRYNRILEGINWIFSNVVQAKTEEELGEACLSVALEVTGSEFGFIIEMGADGLLHDVAKSELAWEQCRMYDRTGHLYLPRDYPVHGLYGSVIINGKSFFTNDPQSHPDSRGLPEGHPLLRSFLGVPLIQDGKTIGSIAVANREGGYNHEQQEDLEAIAPAVVQALQRKKAEEKIQTLANAVESSNDAILTKSLDGIITSWNSGAEKIYGYSAEEVLGKNISVLEPDNTKGETKHLIEKITQGERVQHYETLRMKKDGTIINVSVTLSPVFDASGKLVAISAIARDITENKKAEEAIKIAHENLEEKVKERTAELEKAYESLKESEKSLAEAQRMAHIGNWDWDLVTGEVYWSDEMYLIYGRNPNEPGATYRELLNYIHPEDREYFDSAVNKWINGEFHRIDYRIILTNGEERTVHTLPEVIFDKNDVPIRVKGTTQDITERKKAEERIKTLANIVESSIDAVGTLSLDGIVTSWNKGAEQVYGYSPEEILGKHVSILAPSHLNKETLELIELIKQGKSIYQYETSRLGKDGKKIYVSITFSPVFDTNGKLSAVSFISRNITERKKAEEALRNFEIARKKELHHRIKNNLQVISSLLDLQADLFKGRKTITDSEVLKAFKESIDRVLSIALIHEELYKGKNIDLLNFSQYIKELANNLFLTYSLKTDVSLNFDLEDNLFLDMDTAIPLGMIVNELVSNSFKYAFPERDKGEIRIKLHREGKGKCKINGCKCADFVLTVSDDGIGIPENLNIKDLNSLGFQLVTSLVDQLDGDFELKRNNGTEFTMGFSVIEKDKSGSS